MPRAILELAVDSLHDAQLARLAGADRIELAADLARHGFTPDPALVRDARALVAVPVMAMARSGIEEPTTGPAEAIQLLRDVERMFDAGADGVVFGALTTDGVIDRELVGAVVRLAGGRATVFHRVIDLAHDVRDAVETLVDMGVTRLLTSGHSWHESVVVFGGAIDLANPPPASTLDQRLARIRAVAGMARGRIEILPCGGIRSANAEKFLLEIPSAQLHSACRNPGRHAIDPREARRLRETMDRIQAVSDRIGTASPGPREAGTVNNRRSPYTPLESSEAPPRENP